MANKAISELPQADNVNNQDLFVLEQGGLAKKLTAETFITEQGIIDALAEALDGHGGIQSVTLQSVSGRIRTYLITFTDGSATTFQVYDGTSIDRIVKTSTAGLTDTYTVFMNDGSTTFFTVTNGANGTVSEPMLNDALKDKAPVVTETIKSSAIANFTDGADNLVMHHVVAEINPVQSGSGAPSLSNIRPISGWTGCTVYHSGADTSNPETISISWQSEAGTVYGGTIDVATGLLTVTHALWTKNTSAMDNSEDYPGWKNCGIRAIIGADINQAYSNAVMNCGSNFNVNTTSTRDILFLSKSYYGSSMTQTAWQALAIDVQIVAEFATPQTYLLTPQQIMTLLGTNNVWADIGNVSVTYPADTKLYIEKLTMPTEDDLVANQAITSGKYFMIGNSLYLALANIASGAQITIGTNVQRVSLADALNTINS